MLQETHCILKGMYTGGQESGMAKVYGAGGLTGVGGLPYYLIVDIDITLAIHRLTVMGGTSI